MLGGNANMIAIIGRLNKEEKTDDELLQELQMEKESKSQKQMHQFKILQDEKGRSILSIYLSASRIANEWTIGRFEYIFRRNQCPG